jgi:hypothetical protein
MNIKRKHRKPKEAQRYEYRYHMEQRIRIKHVTFYENDEMKPHRLRYIGDYFVSHTLKGKARVCRVLVSQEWERKNGEVGCRKCFFRHSAACVNHACLEGDRPFDWKSVHFKPLGDLVRMNYDDYED